MVGQQPCIRKRLEKERMHNHAGVTVRKIEIETVTFTFSIVVEQLLEVAGIKTFQVIDHQNYVF